MSIIFLSAWGSVSRYPVSKNGRIVDLYVFQNIIKNTFEHRAFVPMYAPVTFHSDRFMTLSRVNVIQITDR